MGYYDGAGSDVWEAFVNRGICSEAFYFRVA